MRRVTVGLFFALLISSYLMATPVSASSLKIQPLSYNESLEKGEIKKGFVDVSNPTSASIKLESSVQAFRQVDDNGTIEFFDSEEITEGITPDFDEFTLGPREAIRMYFEVDGNKLPSGDVFAGLFVRSVPDQDGQILQAVRVGTLLVLENGTPGARDATITTLSARLWQAGSSLEGEYRIKNDARDGEATGFFPEVDITLTPFGGSHSHTSSLVFAGRERSNTFEIQTDRAGLYYMEVKYGDSSRGAWVFLAPVWFLWTLLIGFIVLAIAWKSRYRRRKLYKKFTRK